MPWLHSPHPYWKIGVLLVPAPPEIAPRHRLTSHPEGLPYRLGAVNSIGGLGSRSARVPAGGYQLPASIYRQRWKNDEPFWDLWLDNSMPVQIRPEEAKIDDYFPEVHWACQQVAWFLQGTDRAGLQHLSPCPHPTNRIIQFLLQFKEPPLALEWPIQRNPGVEKYPTGTISIASAERRDSLYCWYCSESHQFWFWMDSVRTGFRLYSRQHAHALYCFSRRLSHLRVGRLGQGNDDCWFGTEPINPWIDWVNFGWKVEESWNLRVLSTGGRSERQNAGSTSHQQTLRKHIRKRSHRQHPIVLLK